MTGFAGAASRSPRPLQSLADRQVSALQFTQNASTKICVWQDATLSQVSIDVDRLPSAHNGSGLLGDDGLVGLVSAGYMRYSDTDFQDSEPARSLQRMVMSGGLCHESLTRTLLGLDGAWAVALWDVQRREMVLASDRFGSHPVFWASCDDDLTFGTRVHVVLQDDRLSREIDTVGLLELMHFQRVFGTRTLNKQVNMLPPGHYLRWSHQGIRVHQWFRAEYTPEVRSDQEWAEQMAETFAGSITKATHGSGHPSLLLSGGLDSRMIVAGSPVNLKCYHFNDWQNSEHQCASAVAGARGFPFVLLERRRDHYATVMSRSVDVSDGMLSFSHAHGLDLIPDGGLDSLLHGYAPELFFRGTNFPRRRDLLSRIPSEPRLHSVTAGNVVEAITRRLNHCLSGGMPAQWFRPEVGRRLPEVVAAVGEAQVSEAKRSSDSPMDWFTWADVHYNSRSPSFLFESSLRAQHRERSIVFWNGTFDLHHRMPFAKRSNSTVWNLAITRLNSRVAEVFDANTASAPMDFQRRSLKLRFVRGLSMARKPPPSAGPYPWSTDGSWPNWRVMIQRNESLRESLREALTDPEGLDPAIFNVGHVRAALDRHLAGEANLAKELTLLATIALWHRKYGPPARGH